MRTIKYEGMGNINHAKKEATKYLRDKREGTEFRAVYLNGFAVFKKEKGKIVVKE